MPDTSPAPTENLFFEDCTLGARFRTGSHVLTAEDIAGFCHLTLDHHPLHTDAEYARSRGFPGIIAHGLHGLALMEGLKTKLRLFEETSIASVGWDGVKFRQPILPGRALHVEVEFAALRQSRSRPAGLVTERVTLLDDKGTLMIEGTHVAMVALRDQVRRT